MDAHAPPFPVHVKGRQEAVAMLDMMMNDPDFMRFQEEIMEDFENEMMEEIEQVKPAALRVVDTLLRTGTFDSC
jgi:hypothetical protein